MDWLWTIPTMDAESLRVLKKSVDETFRAFTRDYGSGIELLFSPLQAFLITAERLLTSAPWPLVVLAVGALA